MALRADISVPTDALTLGGQPPGADGAVVFEAVVPVGDCARVLFWIDDAEVVATGGDEDAGPGPTPLETVDGRTLCEAEVGPEAGAVVDSLRDGGVHVVGGAGDADGWRLRLLCADRRALATFTERVTDRGIPVTLDRIHRSADRSRATLSDEQQTAVWCALDGGYFDVPRRTTITELAENEGISDSAFSQRLRRGLETLLRQSPVRDLLREGGL